MTLEENISGIIAKKLEDGTIEKVVEEKLTAAIDSAIGDIFRWGDGEKAIKEKLKEVMIPVIERHSFNDYALKLDTVLTNIINQTSLVDNKHILENFQDLMTEPQSKTVKLSEIFEKYQEHVSKNVNTDDLEANCEDGEPYYDWVTVSMDTDEEEERYFRSSFDNATVIFSCEHDPDEELEYTLKIYKSKDNDLWNISGGRYKQIIDVNSLRDMSDFEIFLIRLVRGFVKIEMDKKYGNEEVEPDTKPEWDLV